MKVKLSDGNVYDFPEDASPEEVSEFDTRNTLKSSLTAQLTQERTRPEMNWFQKAIVPEGGTVRPEAPLVGAEQEFFKIPGRLAKTAATVSEFSPWPTEPGYVMPKEERDLKQHFENRSTAEKIKAVQDSPLYKFGDAQDKLAEEVAPLNKAEKNEFLVKAFETPEQMAEFVGTGPFAPAVIGAETFSQHLNDEFDQQKKSGKSDDDAAKVAFGKALIHGGVQGAVFAVLPPALRKLGDKYLVDRFGSGISRLIASRVAAAGETGTVMAASHAGGQAVEGQNPLQGAGAAFAGGALLGAVSPRGPTETEQALTLEPNQNFFQNFKALQPEPTETRNLPIEARPVPQSFIPPEPGPIGRIPDIRRVPGVRRVTLPTTGIQNAPEIQNQETSPLPVQQGQPAVRPAEEQAGVGTANAQGPADQQAQAQAPRPDVLNPITDQLESDYAKAVAAKDHKTAQNIINSVESSLGVRPKVEVRQVDHYGQKKWTVFVDGVERTDDFEELPSNKYVAEEAAKEADLTYDLTPGQKDASGKVKTLREIFSEEIAKPPPGVKPDAKEWITASAVQTANGPEYGPNHPEIVTRLGLKGFETPESRNTEQFGYQSNLRPFITRAEAVPVIEAAGQKLEDFGFPNQPHSNEIASPTEPGKTLGETKVEPRKGPTGKLIISELSDQQVKLLAESAGVKQDSAAKQKLQELENKGLLDSSILGETKLTDDDKIWTTLFGPNAPTDGQAKARAVKKMANEASITVKEMQERVEAFIVRHADKIIKQPGVTPWQKFRYLQDLYQNQPTLSSRTSTSVENQAYSTPPPMSYALGHAIDVRPDTTILDNSAGNGMMLIGGDLGRSHANEINPTRLENLKKLGLNLVTEQDATKYQPPPKSVDRVKVNPPFGSHPNINYGGYGIRRLEHLIALRGLEAMKDDGRAAIIVGAKREEGEQSKGAQWIFENYLYGHYNVVDNFEIEGDLYGKQGAKWPVRVLIVDGRKSVPLRGEFAPKTVDRLTSWDEVWARAERIRNDIDRRRQGLGTEGPAGLPAGAAGQIPRPEEQAGIPRPPGGLPPAPVPGRRPRRVTIGGSDVGRPPASGVREPAPGEGVGGPSSGPSAAPRPVTGGNQPSGVEPGGGRGHEAPANVPAGSPRGSPGPESGELPVPIPLDRPAGDLKGMSDAELGAILDAAEIETKAEKQTTKTKPLQKGEVGGMLSSGEQVLTASGRTTTPFPKVRSGSERGTGMTLREVQKWLRDNAVAEAESRGDEFNARMFRSETGKEIPQASKDSMEEYLFGQQPDIPKPFLKPVGAPPTRTAQDLIKEAAKLGVKGADEALKGLHDLFGGGTLLGSGPAFSEKTYAKAKPHFQKAYDSFKAAGRTLKEFAKYIFQQMTEAVRPYLRRFIKELQGEPKKEPPKKVEKTQFQIPYEPRSKSDPFGTLTPNTIGTGTHKALDELIERRGPVDDFVAEHVGMDVDEMRRGLAAEQVDEVALMIDQVLRGGASINGDETGIGKGRTAAMMIRFALRNGMIPVFFTQDPKLFSDMYGDLKNIHKNSPAFMQEFSPLIFGDSNRATIVDFDDSVIRRSPGPDVQQRILDDIDKNGWDPSKFNAIFSTYSQINKRNNRQQFLERLAENNNVLVILDEAHNAAGDNTTSTQAAFMSGGQVKKGSGVNRTLTNFPGLLRAPGTLEGRGGVVYLSATYAKRPDNMPVYFRTDLRKAAQSFTQIVTALKKGGIALQQAVSEALARSGQYVRRERDFSGVSYDMKKIKPADPAGMVEQVDAITDVLSEIVRFSGQLSDRVKAAGERSTGMTQNQIDMTDFAAIVHNQIGQLLLSAKVDEVVREAKESHARGEKPVVALMNTMESFLDHYVEDKGLKPGDPIKLRWNELLKHALTRTLRATEKTPEGDSNIYNVDPAEYGLQGAFDAISDAADSIDVKYPVSPIDAIIQKLNDAGVKMAELTGRQSGIRYSNHDAGEGTYVRFQKANKNTIVNGFNNGTYDGMLLNASGSTGLSAHASVNFKDQRPRHMIIAQPSHDINVFVQTLGRIRRTGMVSNGIDEKGKPYGARYTHLVLPLQAETRPAAMTARKMKSLNANTTAEADNAIKIDSEDMLNKYGDQIVADYLHENPEFQNLTGVGVEVRDDGTAKADPDMARKFTGRMALLPDDMQKQVYDALLPAYRARIQQLKDMGEYDLEIVVHDDWDGVKREDDELAPATDPSSMFTSGLRVQNWEIKDTRHTPSGDELVKDNNPGKIKKWNEHLVEVNRLIAERTQKLRESAAKATTEVEKANAQDQTKRFDDVKNSWDTRRRLIEDRLTRYDRVVDLTNTETGEVFQGILLDVDLPKGMKFAPSSFKYKYGVNAPGGRLYLTESDFASGRWNLSASSDRLSDLKAGGAGQRIGRFLITGNPIQAYDVTGGIGKLVRFKSNEGEIITGLMMPRNWNVSKLVSDPRLELVNGSAAAHFLSRNSGTLEVAGGVRITTNGYQYSVITPNSARTVYLDTKLRGLTGDFTKSGPRWIARVDANKVGKIADRIMEITARKFKPVGEPNDMIPLVNESNTETGGRFSKLAESAAKKIEKYKAPEAGTGSLQAFGVAGALWNEALNHFNEQIRSGAKMLDAIEAAIKYVKDRFKGAWDEAAARKFLATSTPFKGKDVLTPEQQSMLGQEPERTRTQVYGVKMGIEREVENIAQITADVKANHFDGDAPITPENTNKAAQMVHELTDPTQQLGRAQAVIDDTGAQMSPGILRNQLFTYAIRLAAAKDPSLLRYLINNHGVLQTIGEVGGVTAAGRALRANLELPYRIVQSLVSYTQQRNLEVGKTLKLGPEFVDELVKTIEQLGPEDVGKIVSDIENTKLPDGETVGKKIKPKPGAPEPVDEEAETNAAEQTAKRIIDRIEKRLGAEWLKPDANKNEIEEIVKRYIDPKTNVPLVDQSFTAPLRDELIAAGVTRESAIRLAKDTFNQTTINWQNRRIRATERAANRGNVRQLIENMMATPYKMQKDPAWRMKMAQEWLMANGLSRDQAEGVAKLFDKGQAFEKYMQAAAEKAATDLMKRRGAEPRTIEDLVKAIRIGLTDPNREWSDEVAKRTGWRPLTPEMQSQLAELDLKASDTSLNPYERVKLYEQISNVWRKAGDTKFFTWRNATASYASSLLSGLSTATLHWWQPYVATLYSFTSNVIAHPENLPNLVRALAGSLNPLMVGRQFQFAWTEDAYRFNLEKNLLNYDALKRQMQIGFDELHSKNPVKIAKGAVRIIYGSQQYVQRVLQTLNQGGMASHQYWKLAAYGSDLLSKHGFSTKEIGQWLDIAKDVKETEFGALLDEGQSPKQASVMSDHLVQQSLAEGLSDRVGTSEAAQAVKATEGDVYAVVGRLSPGVLEKQEGGWLSRYGLGHAVLEVAAKWRASQGPEAIQSIAFLGFVAVPFRMARYHLNNTLYGLVRYQKAMRQFRAQAEAQRTGATPPEQWWKQSYANGLQARERLRNALLGTGLMLGAGAVVGAFGYKTSEPDWDKKAFGLYFTGHGPTSKVEQDALTRLGWRKFSMLIVAGGKVRAAIPLTRTGLSFGLSLGVGSVFDDIGWETKAAVAAGRKPPAIGRDLGHALGSYAEIVGSQGALQSIAELSKAVRGEENLDKLVVRALTQVAGPTVTPWKQLQDSIFKLFVGNPDRSSVEAAVWSAFGAAGYLGRMVAPERAGGVSSLSQEVALNRFGDPLYDQSWYAKLAGTGLPIAIRVADTPQNKELYSLMVNKGTAPPELRRSNVEEQYGPLSDLEWNKYVKTSGADLKSRLVENLDTLKDMDAPAVKQFMNRQAQVANVQAAQSMDLERQPGSKGARVAAGGGGPAPNLSAPRIPSGGAPVAAATRLGTGEAPRLTLPRLGLSRATRRVGLGGSRGSGAGRRVSLGSKPSRLVHGRLRTRTSHKVGRGRRLGLRRRRVTF